MKRQLQKDGALSQLELTDEMNESTSDFEVSLILPDYQILLHRIDVQSVPTYLQNIAMALTCAIVNIIYKHAYWLTMFKTLIKSSYLKLDISKAKR